MNFNLDTIEGCTEAINMDSDKEIVGAAYTLRSQFHAKNSNFKAAINDMENGLPIMEQYFRTKSSEKTAQAQSQEYLSQQYFILAEYCRNLDFFEKAIRYYDKSFNLGKQSDFDLFYGRSWCKAKLNLFSEAHLDSDFALEIAKNGALPWQKGYSLFMLRGACKMSLGDNQGANNDFAYANKINPKNM